MTRSIDIQGTTGLPPEPVFPTLEAWLTLDGAPCGAMLKHDDRLYWQPNSLRTAYAAYEACELRASAECR